MTHGLQLMGLRKLDWAYDMAPPLLGGCGSDTLSIPYFAWHTIPVMGTQVSVYSLFLGLALAAWLAVASEHVKRAGRRPQDLWLSLVVAIPAAVIGARLWHCFLYQDRTDLSELLAVWKPGNGVLGAWIGATAALAGYFASRQQPRLCYLDAISFGLPLAVAIGRIGCFCIHDHPGLPTSFPLGMRFPDGIVRHEVALYESLLGWACWCMFHSLDRRRALRPGTFTMLSLAWYGLVRLLVDSVRDDPRYGGLTPSQYAGALMLVGAVCLHGRLRTQRYPSEEA